MLVLGCGGSGGGTAPVASLPSGFYSGTFAVEEPASGSTIVDGKVQCRVEPDGSTRAILYTPLGATPKTSGRVQGKVNGSTLSEARISTENFTGDVKSIPLNLKGERAGFVTVETVQVAGEVLARKRLRVSFERQNWTPTSPSRPAPGRYVGDVRYMSAAVENEGDLMSAGTADLQIGADGTVGGVVDLHGSRELYFALDAKCSPGGLLSEVTSTWGTQTMAGAGGQLMPTAEGLTGEVYDVAGLSVTRLQMKLTRVGETAGKNTSLAAK